MRSIILLLLLFPVICNAQLSFKRLTMDGYGVYFEKIYNVNKRSNYQILKYAVQFANDHGIMISPLAIDKEKNEVTFPYEFKFKANEKFCIYNITFIADVTVGANAERTRIFIHNFRYKADGQCGNEGRLESLLRCAACTQPNINGIERWMDEEIGEHFMWDYKHRLEKYTEAETNWE